MDGAVPENGYSTRTAIPEIGVPFVSRVTVTVVDSPGFKVLAVGLSDTSTVPPGTDALFRGSTELLETTKAIMTPILMMSMPPRVIMMAFGERRLVASESGTVLISYFVRC